MILLLLMNLTAWASSEIDLLRSEVDGAMTSLQEQPEKPHYIAVSLEERREVEISAEFGAIARDVDNTQRTLDVDLRVGTPELDSTHSLRGFSSLDGDSRRTLAVPFGVGFPLRHAVRKELDRSYRDAAERIILVRGNRDVKVAEENPSFDFEPRSPERWTEEVPELVLDLERWRGQLERISGALTARPEIHRGIASIDALHSRKWFVDTEEASLEHSRIQYRLSIQGSAVAEDGDVVNVSRSFDVHAVSHLPSEQELQAVTEAVIERLVALTQAPRGEPYSGPVLLRGRAAGVFVHEVFGHRIEGHRQKREYEGKTFLEYVGEPILPKYLDIVDDPTVERFDGVDLNGFYRFDDEGVAAQPAPLVKNGVFQGFLMHRSPIEGFAHSNGHGRRSSGNAPVARMGNTMLSSQVESSPEALRKQLIAEIRKQGLDYGYIVEEINGGFTMTGRTTPNAFNVRANASWRVYADGRPDELVRGIDLVGTPLIAFSNILGTDNAYEVFNGVCGAESGWVPVSAVAPALLFSRLEFQLKEKGQERPPLLPKPEMPNDGSASYTEDAP